MKSRLQIEEVLMKVYKLFRIKNGKLYPLYVEAQKEIPLGKWLKAGCGEIVDETHVKASGCGGRLRLRSGYHCTEIPVTDWIGKKAADGTLVQRLDTVWCECEVDGKQIESMTRNGYDICPKDSWYYFKTNTKQKRPWIIADKIKINRILSNEEVGDICRENGVEPQRLEDISA
jgi:hypothetical protein